ncbi:ribonuclease Oy-like [Macrosteles quadrilineatus]|uniref:ribonuclease Oy-like n=1 Tax=Macrosteles quadrilineatus TaxID=74068 RepID=UPI0023E28604|nr:ribonuclease Oy-like [Macrosteles quadrilineatus]
MITSNHQRVESPWLLPGFKTRIFIYLFVFTVVSSLVLLRGSRINHVYNSNEWDLLIFTQRWPNTVCMEWEETSPTNHTCALPKQKDIWTIHGIWPTKLGTIGPSFCNSSLHFNASQLAPIMNNLTEYWIDVEIPEPANSFWRHEWRKHGTCSASVPQLSTEIGYFQTGLDLLQKFNMKGVLGKASVYPDSDSPTDLTSIWLAIKTTLGVNPSIHCVHDKKTKQYYLQEIRICFDKSINLVDCDGIKLHHSFHWQPNGNCPLDKPIFYPATVPPPSRKPLPPPPATPMANLLNVIQFVMWLTS